MQPEFRAGGGSGGQKPCKFGDKCYKYQQGTCTFFHPPTGGDGGRGGGRNPGRGRGGRGGTISFP